MNRRFENMEIWQRAYSFAIDTYKILDKMPDYETRNITSQLRRAVTSIPLNISEGSASPSHRDFFRYLTFSYKSTKEVKVLLMLCKDLMYIDAETYGVLEGALDELSAKLYLFIKNIEKRCNYHLYHPNQGYKLQYGDHRMKPE